MKRFLQALNLQPGTLAAANGFTFGPDWELDVPFGDYPVEAYDFADPGSGRRVRVIQRVDAAAANDMCESFNSLRGKLQRCTIGMPIFLQDNSGGNKHPDHPDGSGKGREIGTITGIQAGANAIRFTASYTKPGRLLIDSGAIRSWSPHWIFRDTGEQTPAGLKITRPAILLSGILTNTPNIAGAAANSLSETFVQCPGCREYFDYAQQPEIAMGTVACPLCKAPVSQTAAKETPPMSLLEKIAQMLGINVSVGEDGIFNALQALWNAVLSVLDASERLEDAAGMQEAAAANAKLPIAERITAACNALTARVDAWKKQTADLAAANAKQAEVTGQLSLVTGQLAAANATTTTLQTELDTLKASQAAQLAAANAETGKVAKLTTQLAAANAASSNLQAEIGTLKSVAAAATVDLGIRTGKLYAGRRAGYLADFAADFAGTLAAVNSATTFLKLEPKAKDLAARGDQQADPGKEFLAAVNSLMETDAKIKALPDRNQRYQAAWDLCSKTHKALLEQMQH